MSGSVRLYAAGSLRAAFAEIGNAFSSAAGVPVEGTFGASGLLLERIRKGEPTEIFASANMEHPEALARTGKWSSVRRFTRNQLCALVAPHVQVVPDKLLDRILDPGVRLGTSTPRADPSGDYAWKVFDNAEVLRPGARAILRGKARQLTGGPDSPPPPKDRNVYGALVAGGEADVFLTYCTNATLARRDFPALQAVPLPASLAVGADYGMTVAANAGSQASGLAEFLLSPAGQAILERHGFAPGR